MKSERFEVSKLLFNTKLQVVISPVQHALKMNRLIEVLVQLGFVMDHDLSIDLILSSFPDSLT